MMMKLMIKSARITSITGMKVAHTTQMQGDQGQSTGLNLDMQII